MFRTFYAHHQEDYIVHATLYGMLFMLLCKQSVRLKNVLDEWHAIKGSMYNIVLLKMNIKCSKHVEDEKNLIKTLI